MNFTVEVPAGENFTAAGLMHKYAMENNLGYACYHGRAVVTIFGVNYGFDHWKIENAGNVYQVTVYLFNCDHLMK